MADAVERVLSRPELNRAVLARQLLLERAASPLPRTLERMGGLQAQYAPSMYVGLWSRLEAFERDSLTRATIHLVSRADYWPFELGVRRARLARALRTGAYGVSEKGLAAAAGKLREHLALGPMRRKEIEELLGKEAARGVGLYLDLVRVPPSGTWERRRADLYAAAEDWLGSPDVSEDEGIELLVRRHLRAFGPASRKDIAGWAGLPVAAIVPALERLALRRFRDEQGAELLDLPRAPLPDPATPAPVRFLPTWDATLLVHARRSGVLPEEYRPRIFHTTKPQSECTFLVDGRVAGTWRHDDGRIGLDPFEKLDRATRHELDEEGERLAAFHG